MSAAVFGHVFNRWLLFWHRALDWNGDVPCSAAPGEKGEEML